MDLYSELRIRRPALRSLALRAAAGKWSVVVNVKDLLDGLSAKVRSADAFP